MLGVKNADNLLFFKLKSLSVQITQVYSALEVDGVTRNMTVEITDIDPKTGLVQYKVTMVFSPENGMTKERATVSLRRFVDCDKVTSQCWFIINASRPIDPE